MMAQVKSLEVLREKKLELIAEQDNKQLERERITQRTALHAVQHIFRIH